jgi:hypothetical protein
MLHPPTKIYGPNQQNMNSEVIGQKKLTIKPFVNFFVLQLRMSLASRLIASPLEATEKQKV